MQNNLYWIKYDQYIAIILLLMHFLEFRNFEWFLCSKLYQCSAHQAAANPAL